MPRTPWIIAALLCAPGVAAATPCDRLTGDKPARAAKLFASTYPYDCCDETLARCLQQKPVCKLAQRLRDAICRSILKGDSDEKIAGALERRARSMLPSGKRATFDLAGCELAGVASAPVQLVVYACARCPFCRQVVPDLHRIATSGPLKGQVALCFRPFPISGHKGATEGGMAFVAAQQQRRFWPLTLKLYGEYDRFAPEKLPDQAAAVGLDRGRFARALGDAALRQQLVAAKKEGLRNGVSATPTLFINGRRYHGALDRETLLDVLEEEADRAAKRTHRSR